MKAKPGSVQTWVGIILLEPSGAVVSGIQIKRDFGRPNNIVYMGSSSFEGTPSLGFERETKRKTDAICWVQPDKQTRWVSSDRPMVNPKSLLVAGGWGPCQSS